MDYVFGSFFSPVVSLAVMSWECAAEKRWHMKFIVIVHSFIVMQLAVDMSGFTPG